MITTNNGDVGDDDFVNSHNNNEKAVYSALYLFCTYEESDLFSHTFRLNGGTLLHQLAPQCHENGTHCVPFWA